MIIDLTDIVLNDNKEYNTEAIIELEAFESNLGCFPVSKKMPLQLRVFNEDGQKLKITGTVELEFSVPCDRCLQEVSVHLPLNIIREYPLLEKQIVMEEVEETEYMIGFELNVEGLVYNEILLSWPMKVLCKEDCKGICTKCGSNLNIGECSCDRTELDPRMAAIKDIFSKFKEV